MSAKKPFEYPGNEVNVQWDGRLCIHIGECGRAEGELFVGGRKPWCNPDLASQDEVVDVVQRCPTGALTYQFKDAQLNEQAAEQNTITVTYNGPFFFHGDLQITGAPETSRGLAFRAALCRCGHSKHKPFCDNSHEAAGFKDSGAVGEAGQALTDQGGPLQVKPTNNGPLVVTGNVTIRSGSGREAWTGTRAVLCRCGASGNKPFCDGSHARIGFNDA